MWDRKQLLTLVFLNWVCFCHCADENSGIIIKSPNVTPFGIWGDWDNCTEGKVVTGFQLRVEAKNSLVDDTALNGIRFFCGNPPKNNLIWENVTSAISPFGKWGHILNCTAPFYAVGFDIEAQIPQGQYKDDVGATNMKLICGDGRRLEGYFYNGEDHLYSNVSYVGEQFCPGGYALCGIRTKVEPFQFVGDDTALNNVAGKCCRIFELPK